MATGVEVSGYTVDRQEEVLTDEALAFLAELHRHAQPTRRQLLERRKERREEIARTGTLDFLPETKDVRDGDWTVAEAPADLRDRRVEMTGPTDRKMTINALNSGAKVWLADLEDSHSPTWELVVSGQVNLLDAQSGDGKLTYDSPEGKHYEVTADEQPTVVVRPRGWHLDEKHITVDGELIAGGLVDFGLYFFHNARTLVDRGSGPYFYLPKTESHLEARLWNDVFVTAQDLLGIPQGSVRATVLIETITAAFEMDEILYELRDHASGLNAGRWDYLFSVIKNFRSQGRDFVLPDRNSVGMTVPFMRAYSELLVRTCHRRGAFAIGGMAAQIPSRKDPEANEKAMAKVHEDKAREAGDGYDGSWVAHPDLVEICREEFTKVLGDRPNQLDTTARGRVGGRRRAPRREVDAGRRDRGGPAQRRVGGPAVHPVLALGHRRGRHLQHDGGRRHRRDLALADLAVAAQRHRARQRAEGHGRLRPPGRRRGARQDQGRRRRADLREGPLAGGARRVRVGGPGRRLRRVPDPPGLRADRLSEPRGSRDRRPRRVLRESEGRPAAPEAARAPLAHRRPAPRRPQASTR